MSRNRNRAPTNDRKQLESPAWAALLTALLLGAACGGDAEGGALQPPAEGSNADAESGDDDGAGDADSTQTEEGGDPDAPLDQVDEGLGETPLVDSEAAASARLGETALRDLSEAEAVEYCEEVDSDNEEAQLVERADRLFCELNALFSATTEAECVEAADQCVADGGLDAPELAVIESSVGDIDCEDEGERSAVLGSWENCEATVEEADQCFEDVRSSIDELLGIASCSDVGDQSVLVALLGFMQPPLPPSCFRLEEECGFGILPDSE